MSRTNPRMDPSSEPFTHQAPNGTRFRGRGTRDDPFFFEAAPGVLIGVAFVGERRPPYVITPAHEVPEVSILVTGLGPYDALHGNTVRPRLLHWTPSPDSNQATLLGTGTLHGTTTLPVPGREAHPQLQALLEVLENIYPHPRWATIRGPAQARQSYTTTLWHQDARRQIVRESTDFVLLNAPCEWCGMPTGRHCSGFASVLPESSEFGFFVHTCRAPLCAECLRWFGTCFRCSYFTGLPCPQPRHQLVEEDDTDHGSATISG